MDHQIDISFHKWNYVIGIILLLWPCIIGPEEPLNLPLGQGYSPKKEVKKADKYQLPNRYPLKKKKHQNAELIDEDLFFASFKRQSHRKLLPCLKKAFPKRNYILIHARLVKSGELNKITLPIDPDNTPSCMIQAIKEMRFTYISQELQGEFIQLSWRVDW